MKRFIMLFALSFLVGTTLSCATNAQPPSPDISEPQASALTKKISTTQPAASIALPSATARIKPSLTPPKPAPISTTDPNKVSLPYSSDVPPGDVLAQIAYPELGAGGECEQFCMDVADDSITLTGYSPFQQLRILVYTDHRYVYSGCVFSGAEYLTEWHVTVDDNGYKYLSISGDSTNDKTFYIYDALTGDFIAPIELGPAESMFSVEEAKDYYCTNSNSPNSCPGAPPQRMIVGERGYVCTQSDSVKLREFPSRSWEEITRLIPGTSFLVIGGPSCSDDWSWWHIETEDGIEGWISEGGDNIDPYFICPAP